MMFVNHRRWSKRIQTGNYNMSCLSGWQKLMNAARLMHYTLLASPALAQMTVVHLGGVLKGDVAVDLVGLENLVEPGKHGFMIGVAGFRCVG